MAVARAVLERSKFHREMSRCSDDGRNLFYDGESARR
ncbi:IclR family transcriptional regulator, partial [Burkholderia pseudomallei]